MQELKGDAKWRNSKGSINTNKKLKKSAVFQLIYGLFKKKFFNATESHENAAVHTAILCLSFFNLYIRTLVERLVSRRTLSASQRQLHSAILCFWADPLRSSYMWLNEWPWLYTVSSEYQMQWLQCCFNCCTDGAMWNQPVPLMSRTRPVCVPRVSIMSCASLFLLFCDKEQTNKSVPCGAKIQRERKERISTSVA